MRDFLAINDLPLKLGAKVETPKPLTEAEAREYDLRIFERVPRDLVVTTEGDGFSLAFVAEADCRQVKKDAETQAAMDQYAELRERIAFETMKRLNALAIFFAIPAKRDADRA